MVAVANSKGMVLRPPGTAIDLAGPWDAELREQVRCRLSMGPNGKELWASLTTRAYTRSRCHAYALQAQPLDLNAFAAAVGAAAAGPGRDASAARLPGGACGVVVVRQGDLSAFLAAQSGARVTRPWQWQRFAGGA